MQDDKEFSHQVIGLFLSENWGQFSRFCEERGEDADLIAEYVGLESE